MSERDKSTVILSLFRVGSPLESFNITEISSEKLSDFLLYKKNIFVASKKKNVTQEIIKIIDIEIK